MALWLTLVVVLTCFGGFASPSPVPSFMVFKELIQELDNITQKVHLCNGSMVWNVNLTDKDPLYCAVLESLLNVSNCDAIHKTRRMLRAFCPETPSARQGSSQPVRDTKVEVIQLAKDLLQHLRKIVRYRNFDRKHSP